MQTDGRSRAMRVLLLLAAITYAGLPWEALAGFPLNPASSYLSELAAADQRYGAWFRALDIATGVLVLLALGSAFVGRGRTAIDRGAIGARWAPPTLLRAAAGALAVFAVLTIADATFPMACASSASAVCAQADAAQTLGLAHQVHTLSSSGALAAVCVSTALFAFGYWRSPGVTARQRSLLLTAVLLFAAVTLLVSVLALLSTEGGRLLAGAGIAQRVQVLLVSGYLIGFGWLAPRLRSSRQPTAPAAGGQPRSRRNQK